MSSEVTSIPFTPHVDVWLMIVGLTLGYMWAIGYLGPRYSPVEAPATTKQKALFFSGVLVLWVGSEWPLHAISESYLFSAHTVQHLLFSLVAPPLLLLGIPKWLFRWLFRPRWLNRVMTFVTKPLVALAIFNVAIVLMHWPPYVNASTSSELIHLSMHVLIVGSALIMWWPVVRPLPEMGGLSEPMKMLYLFGQSILPTVPASFLTFGSEPLYSAYAEAPRLWGISALNDQLIAGLIMKLGGGLLLWSVIAAIFFRWHAKELRQETEGVSWDDFEHELRHFDLRRT